ncbi:MAG: hypothetical protein WC623_21730 [Pedobacter sp.]|uniref:hypothetical protein n=1 Tax=Pedobacter sp. TaxID=1411316 RepID=UPI003565306E
MTVPFASADSGNFAVDTTIASLQVCGRPFIGITAPTTINFGLLYPGSSTQQTLTVNATEFTDGTCTNQDISVLISVVPSPWLTVIGGNSNTGITTSVSPTSPTITVNTTGSSTFTLTANVGADVVPASYTQTITVTATY